MQGQGGQMQSGQELDYESLRRETEAAVERSGKSQSQVGRELGVSRGAVSRAVKEAGSKLSSLQCRIIEHLTPYRLDEETRFRVRRPSEE